VQPDAGGEMTTTANYELPPAKGAVTMVDKDNVAELVRLLKSEAKVL
jgi:electron transfer flavoprotein beta subunit